MELYVDFAWRLAMDGFERRKYKRQRIDCDISCVELDSLRKLIYSGNTVNVGQGGLFFETSGVEFEQGDVLRIQLKISPTPGLLEFGGRLRGFVKVLRIGRITDSMEEEDLHSDKVGVAVKFCRPLHLCL
ncbi:MAG: PilZ domain-containing protein [Sedimentisphaerales bacterium]|nr:PilZ domain-containing protein [Sedimentisphaerales bacterium]